MRHDDWTQLNDVVISATTTLLSTHGISAEHDSGARANELVYADTLAIIGLGGQKLRGSVVLSVPAPLLASSHPTGGGTPEELADWLSELANLLLGRLKVQLLERGISIELGTPVTLSGTALRFHRFKGLPMIHSFRATDAETLGAENSHIHVVFEAIGEDGAQLSAARDTDVALDEGEVVLF
jgi:CheY-specific phosphatase CheX